MRNKCKHVFKLEDLELTGIPFPEKNLDATLREAIDYCSGMYTCDATTKRIRWKCCKCNEVFHAHCGLDILEKQGEIFRCERL